MNRWQQGTVNWHTVQNACGTGVEVAVILIPVRASVARGSGSQSFHMHGILSVIRGQAPQKLVSIQAPVFI